MLKKGIILMLLSSFLTCTGQLFWKLAATQTDTMHFIFIFAGLAMYGLGAILMIVAFRFGDVSILHPMLSFGFIVSLFYGALILRETIRINNILGVGLIILGMFFLGKSQKTEGNAE